MISRLAKLALSYFVWSVPYLLASEPACRYEILVEKEFSKKPKVVSLATADDIAAFILREEMEALHGLAKPNFELMSAGREEARERFVYSRDLNAALKADPNFIKNTKAAHEDFKNWFAGWLRGAPKTFQGWRSELSARHEIACGTVSGTPHVPSQDTYRSDDKNIVEPGILRSNKTNPTEGNIQENPPAWRHVKNWLGVKRKGVPDIRSQPNVEIRGLEVLLSKLGRKRRSATFEMHPSVTEGTVRYPHDLDADLFEQLTWERLVEVKVEIQKIQASAPLGGPIASHMRESALEAISDYYHTAITAHLFGKVNNSMLMPEVNTFLGYLGMKPVAHGSLDLVAIRMNYQDFRLYFREYLDRFH